MFASYAEHIEIAWLLVDKGVDTTIANKDGRAALMACVKKGADVHVVHQQRWTALLDACSMGQVEIANILMDPGVDLNIVHKEGMTAWVYASIQGHTTVRIFAETNGDTAMIYACLGKKIGIAKFLVDQGADITIVDKHGITALSYASDGGHDEIVKFFEQECRYESYQPGWIGCNYECFLLHRIKEEGEGFGSSNYDANRPSFFLPCRSAICIFDLVSTCAKMMMPQLNCISPSLLHHILLLFCSSLHIVCSAKLTRSESLKITPVVSRATASSSNLGASAKAIGVMCRLSFWMNHESVNVRIIPRALPSNRSNEGIIGSKLRCAFLRMFASFHELYHPIYRRLTSRQCVTYKCGTPSNFLRFELFNEYLCKSFVTPNDLETE